MNDRIEEAAFDPETSASGAFPEGPLLAPKAERPLPVDPDQFVHYLWPEVGGERSFARSVSDGCNWAESGPSCFGCSGRKSGH